MQERDAGKPQCGSRVAFCMKTDTDVVTLTRDHKIIEFLGLIMNHLYVSLGDLGCIGFEYCLEEQTNE